MMAKFFNSPRVRNLLITCLIVLVIVVYSVHKARVTESLLQGLASPNEATRNAAGQQLLAADNLINATLDEPEWIRLNAVKTLEQAKPDDKTFDTLVKFCKDPSLRVRNEAGAVWGTFGAQAVERAVKELGSGDGNVRAQAVTALEAIGKVAIRPTLQAYREAFDQDPIDWNQRIAAAQALGGLKAEQATKELIEGLKDQNTLARNAARDALVSIGVPTVEPLIKVLASGDPPQPQYAAYILGQIKVTPEVEEDTTETDEASEASDTGETQTAQASTAADTSSEETADSEETTEEEAAPEPYVPEIIFQKAVPALLKALQNDDIATTVAAALGNIGDKRAVAPLIKALNRPAEIAAAAASALGKLGDKRAVMPLVKALHSDTEWIADAARVALTELGKPAIAPLKQMLQEPQPEMRRRALEALAEMKDPALASVLIAHLKDGVGTPSASAFAPVRKVAAEGLGLLRAKSAVGPLVAALADPNWRVSYAARDALVYINEPAIPALIRALASANLRTRLYAQQALISIGEPATPKVIAALNSESPAARAGAAYILGEVGGSDVVSALQSHANDPDSGVRYAVKLALSRIGAS